MRAFLLSMTAAVGLLSASGIAAADDCPLALSLKTAPDAFVAQLNAMPSINSTRDPERKPFFGQCTYQASNFTQFALPPKGLCSIGGQPAFMSMVEILDSEATVISHSLAVLRSEESLAALQSALGKIAEPVTPQADPVAWKTGAYTVMDGVYAHGDDMWTISHQQNEPGYTSTAPDSYFVLHVRRDWLDFARRDLNTCKELPAAARNEHRS